MTFREFIMEAGGCGCGKKGKACSEFEAAKDYEDEEGGAGSFEILAKIKVDAEDEKEAVDKVKEALSEFDAKVKAKKSEKKEDDSEEDGSDEGTEDEAPEAAKRHNGICPDCGQKLKKSKKKKDDEECDDCDD